MTRQFLRLIHYVLNLSSASTTDINTCKYWAQKLVHLWTLFRLGLQIQSWSADADPWAFPSYTWIKCSCTRCCLVRHHREQKRDLPKYLKLMNPCFCITLASVETTAVELNPFLTWHLYRDSSFQKASRCMQKVWNSGVCGCVTQDLNKCNLNPQQ